MSDIQAIIDLSNQIREKQVRYSSLMWTYYTTGMDFEMKAARESMLDIYKDKRNFDLIREYQEKDLSKEDSRRMDILFKSFESYHLSDELNEINDRIFEVQNKLSGILNNHRVVIDGKEVTTTDLAAMASKSSDRSVREKAWRSRAQKNQPLFDGGFLELNKLRREYARLYGAENYVKFSLEKSELDPSLFDGWRETTTQALPEIKKKTAEMAKKYLGHEDLQPWDRQYLSGKICPARNIEVDMMNFQKPIKEMFSRFGFDIDSKNVTFDVFPRKNKSEWGYNFTIDYGKDTRVLANVTNEFYHFWVLMHEAGHAVHYGSVDPTDYIMNQGISGIISEGLANLFGDMIYHPTFFKDLFGGKSEEADTQFRALKD
ncbi:MAG: hypothetical protein KC493_17255, partial [Bacteriovoracaceae bacterium]|nr:hypothetical protein [Bacteriovoracaceae bacterium]